MKKKSIIAAIILALIMSLSCTVWAADTAEEPAADEGGLNLSALFAEDGPLDNLFGEGGTLSEYVPEGIDVDGILQTVDHQLSDPESELNQTINGVIEQVTKDGKIDWEQVQNLIGYITGNSSGISTEELDAILAEFDRVDEAMQQHLFARNEEFFEPSDVSLFSKQEVYMDDIDQEEIRILAKYSQDNYNIDGDKLVFASGVAEPVLMTLHKEEDGSFTVIDDQYAEDGEGFTASLEEMCGQVGLTADDYFSSLIFGACNDVEAIIEYMEEHPEITAAEYMGEMKTKEELQAIYDAYAEEMISMLDEALEGEAAGVEEEAAGEAGTAEEEAAGEAGAAEEEASAEDAYA